MIIRSIGHVITDVPGVKEIRVRNVDGYAEIEIDYDVPGADTFHPAGLEQLIKGLQKALKLAQEIVQ